MKTETTTDAPTVGSSALFGVAFGAFTTTDEYGRDGKNLGWFSTEDAAKKRAAKKGWYGSDGNVCEEPTVTVDGKTYRLADTSPITVDDSDERAAALREQAFAKLSPEEREALGYPSPNDKIRDPAT